MKHMGIGLLLVAVMLVGVLPAPAEEQKDPDWLNMGEKSAGEAPTADVGEVKPIPVGVSVSYTLVSDYIWRGVNFSEPAQERNERCNHMLDISFSLDTSDLFDCNLGAFSGGVWFEWYNGQEWLTPSDSEHLQEVDYWVAWGYEIPDFFISAVEIGYIWYNFPRVGGAGDDAWAHEVYLSLGFDESPLYRAMGLEIDESLINPSFTYYLDVDDVRGSWLELGFSHEFALADYAPDAPVLKDLAVIPSITFGWDHRYFDDTNRLSNITYGLELAYDLSSALGIPAKYGSVGVSGFLNYNQVTRDDHLADYDDTLYGGVTVGYEW